MPEGDSIHKIARRLDAALRGRQLCEARIDGQPSRLLIAAPVASVSALGKHLLLQVADVALRVHLGMDGRWFRRKVGEGRRVPTSVALRSDEDEFLCHRAKEVELLDVRGLRYRRLVQQFGVDLTADDFDSDAAIERARRIASPQDPVCDVLLQQRIASGVGNVFKSEVLFSVGVLPQTPVGKLDDETLRQLYATAHAMLRRNLVPEMRRTRAARPAAVTSRMRNPDDPSYWVYRRAGEPCSVCGRKIEAARFGRHRRSTYWCPGCQLETGRR